ncbi:MAG: SGNH/GDSL hydrolase family protein [Elusimicrobia bacterium]|nr:SGNH/GDSL hydrolase family protein [Elusimicrobiota bacterium]
MNKTRELALFAASLVLSLGLIEIAGSRCHWEPEDSWELNARNAKMRLRTEEFDMWFRTNAQGLREPGYVDPAHPGKIRVAAVGDSTTFGWGVERERVWPSAAQDLLGKKYGLSNVEIVNLGKPGASPEDYLRHVWHAGSLNPDIVLLGFLPGNDCPISGRVQARDARQTQELARRTIAKAYWREKEHHFLHRFFLARFVSRRLLQPMSERLRRASKEPASFLSEEANPLRSEAMARAIKESDDPQDALRRYEALKRSGWIEKGLHWTVNPWRLMEAIFAPYGFLDAHFLRPETRRAMQGEWELCREILLETKKAAARNGAELMILVIPQYMQADPRGIASFERLGLAMDRKLLSSRVVTDLVLDFCRENGLFCIDPLSRFREEAKITKEPLYFLLDAHMTAAGNRLLAQTVAQALAARMLASRGGGHEHKP